MIFTVELEASIVERYRLQKNGEWRNLNNYSLQDSDFQTSNPSEVTNLTPYGSKIKIGSSLYKVSPASGRAGEILRGNSLIFRKDFPDIPNKEQLRTIIATGNDEETNVLILNLNGKFELRQRPLFDISKNDPTVVLRYETFAAGNDYIGEDAAQDDNHINSLYCTCLEGWLSHLRTGKTQIYYNFPCTKKSEQTLEEIELLRSKWTPMY